MPGLPGFVSLKNARVATIVLCGINVILSLHIIISLALTSTTTGRCLLYADLSDFGPTAVCTYVYIVSSTFHLVVCLVRAVLLAIIVAGVLKKEEVLGNKHLLVGCTVVDALACLLTLVSCGMVSHGFNVMCSNLFDIMQCSARPIFSNTHTAFIRNFYPRLSIAEASLWISFFVWLFLILVDVFILWKADILSQLKILPQRKRNETDGNTNQSHRSAVTHLFRSGDSDTDSGPRTPPPQRPVPPRPPTAATTTSSGRQLLKKY